MDGNAFRSFAGITRIQVGMAGGGQTSTARTLYPGQRRRRLRDSTSVPGAHLPEGRERTGRGISTSTWATHETRRVTSIWVSATTASGANRLRRRTCHNLGVCRAVTASNFRATRSRSTGGISAGWPDIRFERAASTCAPASAETADSSPPHNFVGYANPSSGAGGVGTVE